MITLALLFVLVALALSFTLASGLGLLAFVPAALAFAVGIWFFFRLVRGDVRSREIRDPTRLEP